MITSNWKKLENDAAKLIKEDEPKLPKGSGSAKHEEDVVGKSIIIQCKYTEQTNVNILQNDIDRLIQACDLQNKYPLFVTENLKTKLVSIPWTDNDTILQMVINIISINKTLDRLSVIIKNSKNNKNIEIISQLRREILLLKKRKFQLFSEINTKIDTLENQIDYLYDDITMYDLFKENE